MMVKIPQNNAAGTPGAVQSDGRQDDRRGHQRVDTPLKARFLTETGDERSGVVLNISPGGAMIRAKYPPAFGQGVILYIDQIGRMKGRVVRSDNETFAVKYDQTRTKSAKVADELTYVVNNRRRGAERRVNARVKHDEQAQVILEDGRELRCAILDISLTGASLMITPRPPLGAHLILGRMTAKVIRRHEQGVGVVFTGAAERMEDVIEETAQEHDNHGGADLASSFGKRVSTPK